MPARPTVAAVVTLLAGVLATAQTRAQPVVTVVPLGDFDAPTYITVAPNETDLLFVVERPGIIRVLRNEKLVAQPFLDIRDIVAAFPDPGAPWEFGLYSVAFPPNYAQSRRFYVAFSGKDGDSIEINEFRRDATNRLRADPSTRRVVLSIPHTEAGEHYGGQLHFGPDGLLYISTGDGGFIETIGEPARDLNSLLGKILRIDPRPLSGRPYRIPASNPFVGKAGRDEIFAYGLRNPFRFSFDGERIAIADVGHGSREEVNFLRINAASGVNFGWPQYEGDIIHDNTRPGPHPAKFPMFVYPHNGKTCAITGGHVVRSAILPALHARYVYGDFCTGKIFSFKPDVPTQRAANHRSVGISLPGITSFGRGFNGKLYTTQIRGPVSRLDPPPSEPTTAEVAELSQHQEKANGSMAYLEGKAQQRR
jgi:glucose/arabinose dehydrogenase